MFCLCLKEEIASLREKTVYRLKIKSVIDMVTYTFLRYYFEELYN